MTVRETSFDRPSFPTLEAAGKGSATGSADRPPKVLVVMLDGVADRPWPVLGGLTPLEAATTPNLDAFASRAATGILEALGPGKAPGTELAHFLLFGYREEDYPGRGVFEAAGAGVPVGHDQIFLHALLVQVRREMDGSLTILRREPGFEGTDPQAMVDAISSFRHGWLEFRLTHVEGPEAILCISGGGSDHITDTDPHKDGWPVGSVQPLEDASAHHIATLTADATTVYLRHVYKTLRSLVRANGAESPFLLLKWASRKRVLPPFTEHTGMRGLVVSSTRLFVGLTELLGMDHRLLPTFEDLAEDMRMRLDEGLRALEEGYQFVLVHQKAPDHVGHWKDPEAKRDAIAAVDRGLERLLHDCSLDDSIVVVAGDHGTPAGTELIHSGDPVPLAIVSSAIEADGVSSYAEQTCSAGSLGHLLANDIMPVLLNLRGTVRYTSGRLTPHTGLHWPRDYERFTVE